MSLLVWILAVTLGYTALGYWLYSVVGGIQSRRLPGILIPLVVAPVSAVFLVYLSWPLAYRIVTASLVALIPMKISSMSIRHSDWHMSLRRMNLRRQIVLHLALATGAIIFLIPAAWLVSTSLKPESEVTVYPPEFIPRKQATIVMDGYARPLAVLSPEGWQVGILYSTGPDKVKVRVASPESRIGQEVEVGTASLVPVRRPAFVWGNYSGMLAFLPPEYAGGLVPLWNTIYVTILTIIGTVLTSSMVAYSFARLRWSGRNMLFVLMLATMMIPGAVTMLPVFLIYRWLNWVDTLRPLWVGAFFAGPFFVFLIRQFFMSIPTDLEDAAKIDGCGYFGIYWRIMLPLIKPALAAVTIIAFMSSWNSFMGPLIYINSPENMTMAYALQLFMGSYGGERAMLMAAATVVMLPVLVLFFLTQRYFIQGVTLTGLKG